MYLSPFTITAIIIYPISKGFYAIPAVPLNDFPGCGKDTYFSVYGFRECLIFSTFLLTSYVVAKKLKRFHIIYDLLVQDEFQNQDYLFTSFKSQTTFIFNFLTSRSCIVSYQYFSACIVNRFFFGKYRYVSQYRYIVPPLKIKSIDNT